MKQVVYSQTKRLFKDFLTLLQAIIVIGTVYYSVDMIVSSIENWLQERSADAIR